MKIYPSGLQNWLNVPLLGLKTFVLAVCAVALCNTGFERTDEGQCLVVIHALATVALLIASIGMPYVSTAKVMNGILFACIAFPFDLMLLR